ncbi:uncharacterized protein EI90DRAFT_3146928 [Cantharellus anzutake]|uniref:uncharacterized protein n=1 Tax=Cantharellus anzutake TaxID=1750568 RepID=UPI0019086998|nr:uncharacterized protein EI90DRAFT_3146928 [Cantharellus anzutake]KAF8324358.1 hypothetical protein EI90DRAFT_3146928 [Cantharellus anzutake]
MALGRKTRAIDEHKRLLMIVSSGDVKQADAVIIMELFMKAAKKVYAARSFTEQEMELGLLFLRLGGTQLASIAHNALGTPAVTTLRHNRPTEPLRVSTRLPTAHELHHNLSVSQVAGTFGSGDHIEQHNDILGAYILMFDEIKIEEVSRYDPSTNNIVGVCHEHSSGFALEYASTDEADRLFEGVRDGAVHLAVEATIGAVGSLSSSARIYGSHPILISPTCKRENASSHAKLIEVVIEACRNDLKGPLYSLASDGESRRGAALAQITLKEPLSDTSPIYPLLSPLPLFNHLVGKHDITCDKDYKHLFKRLCTLTLRPAGFNVFDTIITLQILEKHLHQNGLSFTTIRALLNPADKQDVPKAIELLKAIWELPLITDDKDPIRTAQCCALYLFGRICFLFVRPYIDITLSLWQQLEHLSAAAHLLLVLFRENPNKGRFMPTQLYVDIQIAVKNVFFCIAKEKTCNQVYIILLGTDRLEIAFEWDRSPRHLRLPSLQELEKESQCINHITPALWKGDVSIKYVLPLTCWMNGRSLAMTVDSKIAGQINNIATHRGIDMLSPFGHLIMKLDINPSAASNDDLEREDEDDISALKIDEQGTQAIPLTMLSERVVEVSFHILTLKSKTTYEGNEDWLWKDWKLEMESSKTKGAYLHPINPTIQQDDVAGRATFIFTKTG